MSVTPLSSDGRPGPGAAIGVIPVLANDPEAPAGCAALRTLRGRPLLRIAVETLRAAGVLTRIVLAVPVPLVPEVRAVLTQLPGGSDQARVPEGPQAGVGGAGVELLAVDGTGLVGLLLAVLAPAGPDGLVLVHDPLHALAPGDLPDRLLDALTPQAAGVVPVRAVTDTLKLVAGDGRVVGTADRERFRVVESPQLYRRTALVAALTAGCPAGTAPTTGSATTDLDGTDPAGAGREREGDDGPQTLPELVRAAGGELLLVPAPAHVDRLATADDVALAEADLAPEGQGIR